MTKPFTISTIALFLAASTLRCGLAQGPCNDFCDFEIECIGEQGNVGCGLDLSKSDSHRCVDACKESFDKLTKPEEKLLDACMTCVDKLDSANKCDAVNEQCDSCAELVASADAFFKSFVDKLRDNNSCYYYDY